MLKHLRIAVTALSLTACVLLIALWVRSYYLADVMYRPLSDTSTMVFRSVQGGVSISPYVLTVPSFFDSWTLQTKTIGQRKKDYWAGNPSWTLRNLRLGIVRRSTHSTLFAPHWLLVLATGALAVTPWINRFSWRFSLRTLLIATTLVAVGLGIVAMLS